MKELRIPASSEKKKASLTIDADTASIVRRIALAEGRARNLSSVVNDMVQAYITAKHPDWTLEDA